ncbi:MAG TPA: tetratricopeptide repeat protein [Dissulfurispiraceae bacterium]|nr:tetratricopeptide repeat protein [Dissulfurispiraceae bacterium]
MKNIALCAMIVAALMIAGCASAPADSTRTTDFHKKLGIAYMNEGKNQLAFVEFQKAMNIDAADAETLYYLGLVYLSFEDSDNAISSFRRAVSAQANYSEAYNSLGVAYLKAGKYAEAVSALKNAVTNPLYKTPEFALYNLGRAYYRMGKLDEAQTAFKTALRRNPDHITPYQGIALAYNRAGLFSDAARALERAMELDPAIQGDREKLVELLLQRILTAHGDEEQDMRDLLEILKY